LTKKAEYVCCRGTLPVVPSHVVYATLDRYSGISWLGGISVSQVKLVIVTACQKVQSLFEKKLSRILTVVEFNASWERGKPQ
jgi:hypothetical protein